MDFGLDNRLMMPYGGEGMFGTTGVNDGASKDSLKVGKTAGVDEEKRPGEKSSPQDCETCKNRKYKDGSDESDVSFQTATHISPTAAGARVRAHEQEHVTNAYSKAAEAGGKVLSVGVAIHTAVCPECGRTYVSGGVTHSVIAYPGGKGAPKIESTNGDPKKEGSAVSKTDGGQRGKENYSLSFGGEEGDNASTTPAASQQVTPASASGQTTPTASQQTAPVAAARQTAPTAPRRSVSTAAPRRVAPAASQQTNPYAAAQKRMAAQRGTGAIFGTKI